MCLGRSTLCIGGKAPPPSIPSLIPLDGKNVTPEKNKNWLLVSKITRGIWITSDKQWKVRIAEIRWSTFVQKKYILPAKTLQRICLTLLSTTCVKIHQILYVIFKTISHFSRHNSSVFFLVQTLQTFDKSSLSKYKFLSTTRVKIQQIPHAIFQTKSQFFFKVWITLQCHER